MTSGKAQPNLIDPDTSRERIELETRVLAAALRQSLEMGDTEGSSLAHRQIFFLLKASQEMGWEEPISLPPELAQKSKTLPDIDWGVADEQVKAADPVPEAPTLLAPADHPQVQETEAAPLAALAQSSATSAPSEKSPVITAPDHRLNPGPSSVSGEYLAQIPGAVHRPSIAPPAAESAGGGAANSASGSLSPSSSPSASASGAGDSNKPRAAIFSFLDFSQKTPENKGEADFYGLLGLGELADYETIHRTFWRMVRRIVRRWATEGLVGAARKELQSGLQKLWIAHDVRTDPVTTADYDFRRIGLHVGDDPSQQPKGTREQVRIGELLRCADLLETTELEIAADMHKAMPEIMFGTFLVKQGFIEDRDLDCVLLGQKLIKSGAIIVPQFQEAMRLRAEAPAPKPDLGDLLLNRGMVTEDQLEEAYRAQVEETIPRLPAVQSATVTLEQSKAHELDLPDSDADFEEVGADEELSVEQTGTAERASEIVDAPADSPHSPNAVENVQGIKMSVALPAWKDHLDWGSPDEAGEQVSPQVVAQEPPTPSSAAAETSKKSLFDLMEGLKTLAPEIDEPLPEDTVLMSSVLNKAAAVEAETQEGPSAGAGESGTSGASPDGRVEPARQATASDAAYDVFPDFKSVTTGASNTGIAGSASSSSSSSSSSSDAIHSDNDVLDLPPEDALEEEMSALDAAAEEAMFEDVHDSDVIEERPSSADEITAEDIEAVRVNVYAESAAETSPDLPAVAHTGQKNEGDKDREREKLSQSDSSGDWKIVSLPGSEIASLFLGEETDPATASSTDLDALDSPDSEDSGSGPGSHGRHGKKRKR
jgi:hypothetical protein